MLDAIEASVTHANGDDRWTYWSETEDTCPADIRKSSKWVLTETGERESPQRKQSPGLQSVLLPHGQTQT